MTKDNVPFFLISLDQRREMCTRPLHMKKREKKIAKVMEAFESHCIPKKNLLYARWIFKRRIQKEGESYDSFVTDCKTLIQDCEYANQMETLTDKIILDSNDYETMDAIIKIGKLPTLDEAVKKF